MLKNEKYYLEATKEFESGSLDEALWAKAQSLTGGDEEKAKFEYIKLRSRSLWKNALADPKQLEVYYPYSNIVFIIVPIITHYVAANDGSIHPLASLVLFIIMKLISHFLANKPNKWRFAIFFKKENEDDKALIKNKFNVIYSLAFFITSVLAAIFDQ